MTENNTDQLITAKHQKLYRIASIANILTWVVLGVSLLLVFSHLLSEQSLYLAMNRSAGPGFWEMLGNDWMRAASLFVESLNTFIRGVVSALILQGISMGLNMIVETDVNYRAVSQGESHE